MVSKLAPSGLLLVAVLSLARHVNGGVITNGGFESGFSGWATTGITSIKTAAFGSGPTEGSNQALMESGNGTGFTTAADLTAFLGVPSGSLQSIATDQVLGGSAIKQTITANAGDVITFNWNFLTNEDTSAPSSLFNDFAFVSLGTPAPLADTFSAFVPSATVFSAETGFHTRSVTVPTTGGYTLGFGVVNVSDQFTDSGLLLDNVSITANAVPEPSTLILALSGSLLAGGVAWLRRRASHWATS